ncbi:hypothetical protein OSTOST_06284, partial [Ostertagia ostertagi]
MAALRHIQLAMCSQYVPDFVTKWRMTLIELITKNLKKTDEEIAVSAVLLALASLQLGEQIGSDVGGTIDNSSHSRHRPSQTRAVASTMRFVYSCDSHVASVSDESISASIKVRFLRSLAIQAKHFLRSLARFKLLEVLLVLLQALRSTWAGIKVTAQGTRLFTTALPSWTLLLQ